MTARKSAPGSAIALPALPRRLADMSPAQVEGVIGYLGSLTLARLRDRQALDNQQIARAWKMPLGENRDTALANPQIDQELVAVAIARMSFAGHRRIIDVTRWR